MNNNTKRQFNHAKRNAAKGTKSTTFGNKTFNFVSMPRLSPKNCPKVGGRGKRTNAEIEQDITAEITEKTINQIANSRSFVENTGSAQ